MSRPIVFIAGIHGVGKGHLADCLSLRLELEAYSASELIKQEKGRPVDVSKIALDPVENQDYLVVAVERLGSKGDRVLLDGHFVLITESDYFNVPESVFHSLFVEAVVLRIDQVDKVAQRLFERDGQTVDVAVLSRLQEMEENRAREVCSSLAIPLIVSEGNDYKGVISELESILSY